MTSKASLTAREVIGFFRDADLDTAELVLELGAERLKERNSQRAKLSDNLKKARAARKPKGQAAQASTQEAEAVTDQPQPSRVSNESPIATARARARGAAASSVPSVQAPSHTAEATSVESDEVFSS